ncbi:MAG: phosphodiester glycosidase family protein [Cyanobacteria bacterium P01_G01_bin.39]
MVRVKNLIKQLRRFILTSISLSLALALTIRFSPAQSRSQPEIDYQTIERSRYTVHVVIIPHNSNYLVSPQIAGNLQDIAQFAQESVVAGINGGYFDPVNQKTTSFIVQQSKVIADPRFNDRLVDNPDLKPYLRKIFNRAEFRRYNCDSQTKYDIQLHFSPIPDNCTLIESLGGGPNLLPNNTSVAEGFTAYQEGEKIRDAIGSESRNARSAVAIMDNQDVMLVMVAQKPDQPLNSGISLPELAEVLANLGAVKAMNLDGGSSASLYYGGQAIYGRVDPEGNEIQRPIKSILSVVESE